MIEAQLLVKINHLTSNLGTLPFEWDLRMGPASGLWFLQALERISHWDKTTTLLAHALLLHK
jgi:hypothetical protein